MEVGLGPCHIVLDGDPIPLPTNGTQPLNFGPCFNCGQTAGWIKWHILDQDMPLGTMVIGLGPGNIVLDADPAPPQGARPPPKFRCD